MQRGNKLLPIPCNWQGGIPVDSFSNVHKRIHENIHAAAVRLELTDLVLFPLGSGAFMRHIHKQDSRFLHLDQGINYIQAAFRRAIAHVWVLTWTRYPQHRINFCLPSDDYSNECALHIDAIIRAIEEVVATLDEDQKLRFTQRVTIHRGRDALELAHELAERPNSSVGMLNGGCRGLVGNHWYNKGAFHAIDENVMRRSTDFCTLAWFINL